MSEDFETGLRDLYAHAAAAHAGGDGFPTTAMAGQVRRNRRVRSIGVSVVTVAAVAGVAIGGAAVVRLNDPSPAPPAVTTQPDQTAETTGPTETVLTCGAVIADLPTFEDAPLTIEATLTTATLPVTDALTATVVMAAVDPPGPTIMAEVVLGLRYLVVQDGVVVGIGRDDSEAPVVGLSGRDGVAHEAEISFAGCDEDGLTTAQLRAGDYALYAGLVAQMAGGPDDATPGDDGLGDEGLGDEGVLLGGPWPITLTDASDASTDPAPADPPALEDLVISFDGLGPLHIGDPVPATPPSDIIRWDDAVCAGTDAPGRWVPVYGTVPIPGGFDWYPFSVGGAEYGTIRSISVDAPGPHTAEGIGVGSTVEELRAAHPEVQLVVGEYSTDAWTLSSDAAVLSFEVAARDDVEWSPEELDHVVRVHVLPPDTTVFNNQGFGELCG